LLPRNLLGRGQKVLDGIGVEVALMKRSRVSGIKQLAGVSDVDFDA
jgi:hypothetical protein